eukprot:6175326-Pleurochrysis_carterae.AAC.2
MHPADIDYAAFAPSYAGQTSRRGKARIVCVRKVEKGERQRDRGREGRGRRKGRRARVRECEIARVQERERERASRKRAREPARARERERAQQLRCHFSGERQSIVRRSWVRRSLFRAQQGREDGREGERARVRGLACRERLKWVRSGACSDRTHGIGVKQGTMEYRRT